MKVNTVSLLLALIVVTSAALRSRARAEEEQEFPAAALRLLSEASESPPTSEAEIGLVCNAVDALVERGEGAGALWTLATDTRQAARVRRHAINGIVKVAELPREKVRGFLLNLVQERDEPPVLRIQAALALRAKHLGRASRSEVCEVLEAVLLRPEDNHVLQRTCLHTFSEIAEVVRVKQVLLSHALQEHPYFGIRADICMGLGSLGVRERKALEILCSLMLDSDPADEMLGVPQEAWLSFWWLTGRSYGVEDELAFSREGLSDDERVDQSNVLPGVFPRRGVSLRMLEAVRHLTCRNWPEVVAARQRGEHIRWVRNTDGLRAAASKSRQDIDAICAEWTRELERESEQPGR